MTSNPPAVQQVGGAVLVQGREGLDQFAKCVLAQIREVQRNGYSVEPYAQLLRTIHTARMSQPRHELASYEVVEAHSDRQDVDDWIDVTEAAEILAVTRRQVQRLAPSFSPGEAKRIGKSWALKRAPVLALAEQRRSQK
jgi:ABC-type dipeptide/oligopeptide/nickel transport system ATPase subunit